MTWSGLARFFTAGVAMTAVGFVVGSLAASAAAAQPPARSKSSHAAAPSGSITSFNFNNIPVRSALQLIADEGRFNLIVSDSVQGNISLRLNDVTWEQALELVLRIKGLQQRIDGDSRAVTIAGG
jgi:type IV pilus assembly protein PilQ